MYHCDTDGEWDQRLTLVEPERRREPGLTNETFDLLSVCVRASSQMLPLVNIVPKKQQHCSKNIFFFLRCLKSDLTQETNTDTEWEIPAGLSVFHSSSCVKKKNPACNSRLNSHAPTALTKTCRVHQRLLSQDFLIGSLHRTVFEAPWIPMRKNLPYESNVWWQTGRISPWFPSSSFIKRWEIDTRHVDF